MTPNQQPFVVLKDSSDTTAGQVNLCLSAVATLKDLLFPEEWLDEARSIPGKERELEGGCPAAAAVAFIAACDRLRGLLSDDRRFAHEPDNEGAAEHMKRAAAAAIASSRATEEAARAAAAPHARLRPTLARVPDGWAAVYGDPSSADTCIVGRGTTPAEALLSFDQAMNTPHKGPARQQKKTP